MKLLLHDTLATAPLVFPFAEGWIDATNVEYRPAVTAADVGQHVMALVPAPEIAMLQSTHLVAPEVAVVCEGHGMIGMRVPVRPDEISAPTVRLYEVSSSAEVLARATLEPFYGIVPAGFTDEDSADAKVVVVEGADALIATEGGFSEDLVRAWFILTGQPVVTHLLAVPKEGNSAAALETMRAARDLGHERRRDLRRSVAERFGVDRERIVELATSTRYELRPADRRALMMLLQNGNKGFRYPYLWQIGYLDDAAVG